ncbi:acyltransferase [Arthrobacter sp. Y-9]|uniref:acyltransferase n=1 Tax=Arthrobacter sp. Y-9 TaxID=3039385 RepID=UPI00325AE2E0
MNRVFGSSLIPNRFRAELLHRAGLACRGALISDGVHFSGSEVSIGDGSFINREVYFDHGAQITIGRNVAVGMRAMIVTSTHSLGTSMHRAPRGSWKPEPITIDDGSWVGAGSILLPGVTIGKGSVVAAGSVVTKDVPPNVLVAGIPASVIRSL